MINLYLNKTRATQIIDWACGKFISICEMIFLPNSILAWADCSPCNILCLFILGETLPAGWRRQTVSSRWRWMYEKLVQECSEWVKSWENVGDEFSSLRRWCWFLEEYSPTLTHSPYVRSTIALARHPLIPINWEENYCWLGLSTFDWNFYSNL